MAHQAVDRPVQRLMHCLRLAVTELLIGLFLQRQRRDKGFCQLQRVDFIDPRLFQRFWQQRPVTVKGLMQHRQNGVFHLPGGLLVKRADAENRTGQMAAQLCRVDLNSIFQHLVVKVKNQNHWNLQHP